MLEVKNWDREGSNLKKIYFSAKISLERGVTAHAVRFGVFQLSPNVNTALSSYSQQMFGFVD